MAEWQSAGAVKRTTTRPGGPADSIDGAPSSELSNRDHRRLLANSVFHDRPRPDPNGMMMSISEGAPGDPVFVWFGDAPFADLLGQQQSISCIPSGRIRFSEPETFITAMAARCCEEITAAHPSGDLIFGGFCFDAWIAYEAAIQLARSNRHVERIIMVEAYTLDPFERRFNTYADRALRLGQGRLTDRWDYLKMMAGRCWRKWRAPAVDEPIQLPSVEDEIMVLTHDAIDAYGCVHSALDVDLLFGAESWHSRYYRYAERLHLARAGWHQTLGQSLTVHLTPGDHDTVLDPGNIEALALAVQARIEAARPLRQERSSAYSHEAEETREMASP